MAAAWHDSSNIPIKSAMELLTKLHENSSSDSENALHWKKDPELCELEQEYKRLKKQKEELLVQAKEAELIDEIRQYEKRVEENGGVNAGHVPLGQLSNEDVLFNAIKVLKEKKLTETYNVYKLAGIACVFLDHDVIQFSFDTSYRGQYFTTYYMEVEMTDEKIKILKHTVPFFIPVKEIAKNYHGSEGLKDFVDIISVYLNSFIARQRQFTEAQENSNYTFENFFSSPAFDFVTFKLKFPSMDRTFSIKMKYTDLKDTLPKEVDVITNTVPDMDGSFAEHLKKDLKSIEIQQALTHL